MKVLYDHQMFSRQKYGGITKYFCELLKHYPEGNSFTLGVLLSNNQHLKDDSNFFKKIYFPIPQKESRIRGHLKSKLYQLNTLYSRGLISSNNYDLFHPTYFDPYFLNIVKKPYVVTVHDLIIFKFNEADRKKDQMAEMTKIIKKARRIIAVSENTKADLINILKVSPERIDIVYHGFNKFHLKNNVNPYGRYILHVGARPAYKNFKNLAMAFKKLVSDDEDLKLLCVGASFSKEELEELKAMKILKNTIAMGVNETKLNQLYSHALAFVYPTQYEGFGMSILEAFSNDCPVCLSNTSCLPEIAGEAGIYFDPLSPESIESAIRKTIYDPVFSQKMTEAGQKRLLNFSWDTCAAQTMQSYEKALS